MSPLRGSRLVGAVGALRLRVPFESNFNNKTKFKSNINFKGSGRGRPLHM
jgi:hypothetical protein